MKSYQEINKDTIDKWVEEGWEWGKPVSHEEYINAKNVQCLIIHLSR